MCLFGITSELMLQQGTIDFIPVEAIAQKILLPGHSSHAQNLTSQYHALHDIETA